MAAPGFGKDMFSNLKTELPGQLPAYLKGQRWFGAKARELRATEVVDFITLERDALHALIVMVKVEYEGGGVDLYSVPLVVSEDPGSKGEPGAPSSKDPRSYRESGTPGGEKTAAVLTVSGRNGGETATLTDALEKRNISFSSAGRYRKRIGFYRGGRGTGDIAHSCVVVAGNRRGWESAPARDNGGAEQQLRGVRGPLDLEVFSAAGRGRKSRPGDVRFSDGQGPLSAHTAVVRSTGISRSARSAHDAGDSAGIRTESGRCVAIHDEVDFEFL